MAQQNIEERLLYQAVRKLMVKTLSPTFHEFGEYANGIGPDKKEAKLLMLEMCRNAFGEIYLEIKSRIESAKSE